MVCDGNYTISCGKGTKILHGECNKMAPGISAVSDTYERTATHIGLKDEFLDLTAKTLRREDFLEFAHKWFEFPEQCTVRDRRGTR